MFEEIEVLFKGSVAAIIMGLEIIGAIIIVISAVNGLLALLTKKGHCRMIINKGITTALTFLLCGEALKTIIAPDWKDIGMTCAILVMRAAMSLLIHWETVNEEKEAAKKKAQAE